MSAQDKREVSVQTKPKDVQKAAVDLWMRPYEEFERLFHNMFEGGWSRPAPWNMPKWGGLLGAPEVRMPSVDVVDADDYILVRAEVPGVDKENLEVAISQSTLTIKGRVEHEDKKESRDYFRHEISRSAFSRSIPLPAGADPSKEVSATLKDGMLEVRVCKVDGAKRQTVKVH